MKLETWELANELQRKICNVNKRLSQWKTVNDIESCAVIGNRMNTTLEPHKLCIQPIIIANIQAWEQELLSLNAQFEAL